MIHGLEARATYSLHHQTGGFVRRSKQAQGRNYQRGFAAAGRAGEEDVPGFVPGHRFSTSLQEAFAILLLHATDTALWRIG